MDRTGRQSLSWLAKRQFSRFYLKRCQMTLVYTWLQIEDVNEYNSIKLESTDFKLNMVLNQDASYLGQRSFISTAIVSIHTKTHTSSTTTNCSIWTTRVVDNYHELLNNAMRTSLCGLCATMCPSIDLAGVFICLVLRSFGNGVLCLTNDPCKANILQTTSMATQYEKGHSHVRKKHTHKQPL